MRKHVFGVDVGGTTVKMGLFTEDGELLEKWEIPTRKEENGSYILRDVADSLLQKTKERSLQKEDILGVGVGVPGPVNSSGVILGAVNLGWKESFSIVEKMQEMTGFSCKASNDANVAALGEMWKGGGQGFRNLVLVTLGTGIGGGIILDGKIWNGTNGSGGEIGHIHLQDGEPLACNCGNHGCFEQYGSATGIVRLAQRYFDSHDVDSVLKNQKLSAKSIFDAAKDGDVAAQVIIEQYGEYLGKGLASIATIVDPEAFVIGGGVSKAGDILFSCIRPAFEKYVFLGSRNTKFTLASLGNDAGIFGAAGLLIL